MNRRTFLAAAGATIVGRATTSEVLHRMQDVSVSAGDADRPDAWPLRTVTYNVLACRGFMGAEPDREILRRRAPQIPARIALELALYEPDLITFQESPAESVSADIAQRLGMNYAYFPGGFPGTVLTKHEIVESTNRPAAGDPHPRDLFTRHWGKAVLKTPSGELTVYSAHLFPGGGGGNNSNQETRRREVRAMLDAMRADLESDRSVMLQGDLNLDTDNELYPLFANAGLRDAFAEKGTGQEFTGTSVNPWWRVDFVMSKGPIAGHLTECRVLYEGAFRTNPDDPTSVALSDHLPVLAVFE